MIASPGNRVRALIVMVVALVLSGVVGAPAQGAPPPTPVYSPPPREASPFTSRDSFCTNTDNEFDGVKPNDPRLTAGKITVVMLMPKPDPAEAIANPALNLGDPSDEAQTFADLINKCGGIGGRKIDFHVLVESDDPFFDCVEATQVLHAFIVVSWTASPAQSCIVNNARTIMVTESNVSNDALAGTQGRLVATGSTEGVLEGRLLDVIHNRLDGKRVAVVTGTSADDLAFNQMATALLRAQKITIVPAARADALLVPAVVPAMLPLLAQPAAGPTTTQRKSPLEIYGFSDVTDQAIDELRKTGGPPSAQVVNSLAVFSFTPVAEEQARLGEPAGSFATMCNEEYAAKHGKAIATASLPQPSPPASSNAPYIRVAKVCLAMRIVARSLFSAGVNPTQPLVIKALHKLPYIENELFAGPKPRPNQVVNEPVARVEQVVVLSQAEYPCTHPAPPKNPADAQVCWAPVSGWDNGGKSVNAPLLAPNFATAGIPKELLTN